MFRKIVKQCTHKTGGQRQCDTYGVYPCRAVAALRGDGCLANAAAAAAAAGKAAAFARARPRWIATPRRAAAAAAKHNMHTPLSDIYTSTLKLFYASFVLR